MPTIRGMKRTLLTTLAAALLLVVIGQTARATEVGYSRKFGLGVVIGDPTGGGGRLIWWGGCQSNCVAVAARAPIGLSLMFQNPSFLEVFFELAPSFWIVPDLGFGIEGGIGVRFYF